MTKTELVEFIAAKAGLTKADASRALDATIEGITAGLKKEGKVALVGFSTFEAKNKPARECTNPMTGAKVKVAACKAPVLKFGKNFKDCIN